MRTSTRSTRSTSAPSRSAISASEPTKYPASSSASISAAPIMRSTGIGKQDRGLTLKMVAKRQGFGDVSLEVRGVAGVLAGADARPGVARSSPRQGRIGRPARCGPRSKAFSTSVPRLAASWPASVSSASPAQSPGSAGASAKPPASAARPARGSASSRSSAARAADCSPIRSR